MTITKYGLSLIDTANLHTCDFKLSTHFSTDSRLIGGFFTGVAIFAYFFSGDGLSFTELVHNRFSFPRPSSGKDGEELGFLGDCFPTTSLLEQLVVRSGVVSENKSFLLEVLLEREGRGLGMDVAELSSFWGKDFDRWCLELLIELWSISLEFSAFLLEDV